jgi:hypothetical protein
MNTLKTILLGMTLLLFVSCGNDKKKTEPEVVVVDTTEKKEYHAAATEVEFNDPKVADVYQEYINVKTALVNTNAKSASDAASNLMTALANVGVEEDVFAEAQKMVESSNIEEQRRAFVPVTTAVEKLISGAITSGKVYKQFCPMAFNNQGAFWLSNSSDIYNPFFGDVMLKCGRVDSEIKKD